MREQFLANVQQTALSEYYEKVDKVASIFKMVETVIGSDNFTEAVQRLFKAR